MAIGLSRHIRGALLFDILAETGLLVLLLRVGNTLEGSAENHPHGIGVCGFLGLGIFVAILLASGKAPFDLAEAESELIAGITTDVGGMAFSFVLLADYAEFIFWVILF